MKAKITTGNIKHKLKDDGTVIGKEKKVIQGALMTKLYTPHKSCLRNSQRSSGWTEPCLVRNDVAKRERGENMSDPDW